MKSDTILNLAAGKFQPLYLEESEKYFIANVDTMYYKGTTPEQLEAYRQNWMGKETQIFNVAEDALLFMDRTSIEFQRICCYRFLEHVPMEKVLYFIYLMSTITKKGAEIDVIVPNYEILAQKILDEEKGIKENTLEFESHNIELTTELLNEPHEPHASIWTKWRAKYFFELEGRFHIFDMCPEYEFDGRDCYLRVLAERL